MNSAIGNDVITPEELIAEHKRTQTLLQQIKNSLTEMEKRKEDLLKMENETSRMFLMEILADKKKYFEELVKTLRLLTKHCYKDAIERDIDVDGSRRLKVYRFFYRNHEEIHRLLGQIHLNYRLPFMGIVILSAIFFIYAEI